MRCKSCGNEVKSDFKYCPFCSSRLMQDFNDHLGDLEPPVLSADPLRMDAEQVIYGEGREVSESAHAMREKAYEPAPEYAQSTPVRPPANVPRDEEYPVTAEKAAASDQAQRKAPRERRARERGYVVYRPGMPPELPTTSPERDEAPLTSPPQWPQPEPPRHSPPARAHTPAQRENFPVERGSVGESPRAYPPPEREAPAAPRMDDDAFSQMYAPVNEVPSSTLRMSADELPQARPMPKAAPTPEPPSAYVPPVREQPTPFTAPVEDLDWEDDEEEIIPDLITFEVPKELEDFSVGKQAHGGGALEMDAARSNAAPYVSMKPEVEQPQREEHPEKETGAVFKLLLLVFVILVGLLTGIAIYWFAATSDWMEQMSAGAAQSQAESTSQQDTTR